MGDQEDLKRRLFGPDTGRVDASEALKARLLARVAMPAGAAAPAPIPAGPVALDAEAVQKPDREGDSDSDPDLEPTD